MRFITIPLLMLWFAITASAQSVFNDDAGRNIHSSQESFSQSRDYNPYRALNPYQQWRLYTEETGVDRYARDYSNLRQGWNMDLQIGAGAFVGTPLGCGNIISKVKPAFRAHLGKWFTPSVGSRLSWEGSTLKAADMSMQRYQAFHMDLLWNLAPMISEEDNFTLAPYFGTGCLWNQSVGHAPMAMSYGVAATVKVSRNLSAVVELGALSTFKYFDGVNSASPKQNCGYRMPRMGDNIVNLTVGLSYTIPSGKKPVDFMVWYRETDSNPWNNRWNQSNRFGDGYEPQDKQNPTSHGDASDEKDGIILSEKGLDSDKSEVPTTRGRLYTTEELLALAQQSNQARKAQEEENAKKASKNQSMLSSEPVAQDSDANPNFSSESESNSTNHTASKLLDDNDLSSKPADSVCRCKHTTQDITLEEGDHVGMDEVPYNEYAVSDYHSISPSVDSQDLPSIESDYPYERVEDDFDSSFASKDYDPVSSTSDEEDELSALSDEDATSAPNREEDYSFSLSTYPAGLSEKDGERDLGSDSYNHPYDNNPDDDNTGGSDSIGLEDPVPIKGSNPEDLDEEEADDGESYDSSGNGLSPSGLNDTHSTNDGKGERLLLSPTIAYELEVIFNKLKKLEQDDDLPSWTGNESYEEICFQESLRMSRILASFRALSNRLREIMRLDDDSSGRPFYLWVKDSQKAQGEDHSLRRDATAGKRLGAVVTKERYGNPRMFGRYTDDSGSSASDDKSAVSPNDETEIDHDLDKESNSSDADEGSDDSGTKEEPTQEDGKAKKKPYIKAHFNIIRFREPRQNSWY